VFDMYKTYLFIVNIMSLNPDRDNLSESRRSRSNEGNGYDEGRNVRAAIIRPCRQHSLTSEIIQDIANEHGINPQIAGRISLGEHLTLSDGTNDDRRRIIERARQESLNRNVDEGVRHTWDLYVVVDDLYRQDHLLRMKFIFGDSTYH